MIKIQKRYLFCLALIGVIVYILCNLYWPLSEKEQIQEQQTNLDKWLLDDQIDPSIFKFRGKRSYNSRTTGKRVEEFIWLYEENRKTVILSLPIVKRRIDVSMQKGPGIEDSRELLQKLRNRN